MRERFHSFCLAAPLFFGGACTKPADFSLPQLEHGCELDGASAVWCIAPSAAGRLLALVEYPSRTHVGSVERLALALPTDGLIEDLRAEDGVAELPPVMWSTYVGSKLESCSSWTGWLEAKREPTVWGARFALTCIDDGPRSGFVFDADLAGTYAGLAPSGSGQ